METNPPTEFGTMPQVAAEFGSVPQAAASFGSVRKDAESFRTVPQHSEGKENHTLTVREVSRRFEAAGVARSERSIVNWCQRNALGAAKLDAYFDPNERKYFITPESVEVAIAEEQAKAEKHRPEKEGFGSVRKDGETPQPAVAAEAPAATGKLRALETELLSLQILNQGKDYVIEQLKQERGAFIDQLLDASRKVGELENKLLQIAAPSGLRSKDAQAIG